MALYPLATSYFGVEHVAVLEHPVLGTALSIPGVAEHAALVDVSLEPDTYTNGWRIRSDFGFLGFLDEVEAAEYPALERLKNSFAQPQTSATVEVVDGKVEVAVSLGMWPWMVPVNDQPQGTALLAGGPRRAYRRRRRRPFLTPASVHGYATILRYPGRPFRYGCGYLRRYGSRPLRRYRLAAWSACRIRGC